MPTKSAETAEYEVAIVGGGLAGLTAAWKLQQRGINYVVLEANACLGGLIQTETWNGCLMELGPDGFVARKPAFRNLAQALGLPIQDLLPTKHRIYLTSARGTWPLPAGQGLLVPMQVGPFLASPILSLCGRLRVLAERFLPPTPPISDETLAQFVRRRFGQEVLRQIAEPLLGGVYNTDPETLSLTAAFPQYSAMERRFGSITRGMHAAQTASAPEGGGIQSLSGGMGMVIQALQNKLTGQIHTSAAVKVVRHHPTGYALDCPDGRVVTARSVILAVPAQTAGELLTPIQPASSDLLGSIGSAGIGSISMVFRTIDLAKTLDAWGLLYARDSQSPIDGLQWATSKWPGRAPADMMIIRAFFGGFRHREMLQVPDDQIVNTALNSLTPFLRPGATPLHYSLKRWNKAFPQYAVGHVDLVSKAETLLPPTIRLAGQAFHGVGLAAVVTSAERAALAIATNP